MAESAIVKVESPRDGMRFWRWLRLCLLVSVAHFALLACIAAPFAWSLHTRLLIPFALFGWAAEWILVRTIGYRGEDVIQWPIIVANSLAYGAVISWGVVRWRKHRQPSAQETAPGAPSDRP